MNRYLTRLITHILIEDESARDNWMDTIKQVHEKELSLLSYPKEMYFDVLFSKKLSNVHTIKRLWQLVQEQNPELRGKKWKERQKQGGMVAEEFAEQKFLEFDLFSTHTKNIQYVRQNEN